MLVAIMIDAGKPHIRSSLELLPERGSWLFYSWVLEHILFMYQPAQGPGELLGSW